MPSGPASWPLVVRNRPLLRAAALWGLGTPALVLAGIALAVGLGGWGPARPAEARAWIVAGTASLSGVLLIGVLGTLCWRLRVDEQGIARRQFVRWQLWPWEAFADGTIRDAEGQRDVLVWWPSPRLARTLNLSHAEEPQRQFLRALVRQQLVRAPLVLPVELTFNLRRQSWRLASEGFQVENRHEFRWYSWEDVRWLRIIQVARDRQDFARLSLWVKDDAVTLDLRINPQGYGRVQPNWKGAPAETIASTILRWAPSDRARRMLPDDPPLSAEEADLWLDELNQQDRRLAHGAWAALGFGLLLVPLTFGALLAAAFFHGLFLGLGPLETAATLLKAFLMEQNFAEFHIIYWLVSFLMSAIMGAIISGLGRRSLQGRCARVEAWKAGTRTWPLAVDTA